MGRQLPTSRKTPPLRQPCGHLDLRHPASKLRQQTPAVSAPDPRLRHLCGAQAKGKVLQRKVHLWSRPGGKPLGQDQGRGRQAEKHRSTSHPAESSGPGYMGSYTLGAEREPPAGVMRAPRGAPQRGRDLEKVGHSGAASWVKTGQPGACAGGLRGVRRFQVCVTQTGCGREGSGPSQRPATAQPRRTCSPAFPQSRPSNTRGH